MGFSAKRLYDYDKKVSFGGTFLVGREIWKIFEGENVQPISDDARLIGI